MNTPHLLAPALVLCGLQLAVAADGGFTAFDRRAQAGDHLNVVFFGASLTWGANASDQDLTSYRAVVRDRFAERYPTAHIRCWDAAIGGTGSVVGAFRLERDVLSRKPDLVFLDFTANDGIYGDDAESLSSYESILRRMATAGIPVVQVAFPFRWDVERTKFPTMKRRDAHRALATAYGNGWGDAVEWITAGIEQKRYGIADIWVTDGAHPHDLGYREFAAAAWNGYENAVHASAAPQLPAERLYPDTYAHLQRFRLDRLPELPAGWRRSVPLLTAINHDWLMSRWLDGLVVVRNRELGADGKPLAKPLPVAPLRLSIQAATIVLFGEATAGSGHFRVRIDGQAVTGLWCQPKDADWFDANRWKTGNGHLVFEIARGLDAGKAHLVEIEPLFPEDQDQELRIESVCVAGGPATVALAP
jgi:lysophospholipase L1-like esterase